LMFPLNILYVIPEAYPVKISETENILIPFVVLALYALMHAIGHEKPKQIIMPTSKSCAITKGSLSFLLI